MKRSKKFLALLISAALVAAISAMPTLSWLSDTSERVVNTFAGGAISIVLDEAPVDAYGKEIDGDRVTSNSYKYVAGVTLDKDPTATVLKGSEACYVFILVENELNDLFSLDIDTDSWKQVAQSDGDTLYIYSSSVDASQAPQDIVLEPIFTHVKVSEELTQQDIEALGEKTLCTTAYAVQTAELTSQQAIDLAVAEFMPEGTTADYVEIV